MCNWRNACWGGSGLQRLLQVHYVTALCLPFSSFFLLSPSSTTFGLETTASTRSYDSSNLGRNTSMAFCNHPFCHRQLQKKQNTVKIYLRALVNNLVVLFVCCWNTVIYIRLWTDGPNPFAQSFTMTPLILVCAHCRHRTGLCMQRCITALLTPLQSEEEILSLLALERFGFCVNAFHIKTNQNEIMEEVRQNRCWHRAENEVLSQDT